MLDGQSLLSHGHWTFAYYRSIIRKWPVIAMDFISPLPLIKKGPRAILTVVSKLPNMVRFIAVTKNNSVPETALFFKEPIYRNHGLHDNITSVRDPIFMSYFWKYANKFCKKHYFKV